MAKPETISIPCYLLNDSDIHAFLKRAVNVMTELAGESDTAELPPLISQLQRLIKNRNMPIKLQD